MSTLSVDTITDASGGTTASINGFTPTASNMAGKNRIINGDCRIDQRNAGASVTATGGDVFVVDRFKVYQGGGTGSYTGQQSATAPAGFKASIVATVASTGSPGEAAIIHIIEGYNLADIGFGTSNAVPVTVSFWVRSSVTGTYAFSFRATGGGRSYVTSYTINAANTWEYKTITIASDTTGSWNATNGVGLIINWGIGSTNLVTSTANTWLGGNFSFLSGCVNLLSTSGATFYITGVQLEAGSVATSFERVDYSEMLRRCQRYYYRTADDGVTTNILTVAVEGATSAAGGCPHPVSMRAVPTITIGSGIAFYSAASGVITPTINTNRSSTTTFAAIFSITGATPGQAGTIYRQTTNGFVEASSEL